MGRRVMRGWTNDDINQNPGVWADLCDARCHLKVDSETLLPEDWNPRSFVTWDSAFDDHYASQAVEEAQEARQNSPEPEVEIMEAGRTVSLDEIREETPSIERIDSISKFLDENSAEENEPRGRERELTIAASPILPGPPDTPVSVRAMPESLQRILLESPIRFQVSGQTQPRTIGVVRTRSRSTEVTSYLIPFII
jgi:hypothetical protein